MTAEEFYKIKNFIPKKRIMWIRNKEDVPKLIANGEYLVHNQMFRLTRGLTFEKRKKRGGKMVYVAQRTVDTFSGPKHFEQTSTVETEAIGKVNLLIEWAARNAILKTPKHLFEEKDWRTREKEVKRGRKNALLN